MRAPRFALASAVLFIATWTPGCGGSGAGAGATDGGQDGPAGDGQGSDGDSGAERLPGVTCPAVAAGETRGLGACCGQDADCGAGGLCWNGYCSRACAADTDCGPAVAPSPLPAGTALRCATNMMGAPWNLCLAGSLKACDGLPASCDTGETCALGLDPATKSPGAGFIGLCLTRLIADKRAQPGEACDDLGGPTECETQGGWLRSGCLGRRCTVACTPGRSDSCPVGMACEGPVAYAYTKDGTGPRVTLIGAGVCLGRACGSVQEVPGASLGSVRAMGTDSMCDAGDICVPTVPLGTGDTIHLSCVKPRAVGKAYGETCASDPSKGMRCVDDALCLEPDGPGSGFCSRLCRRDGDCPADATCLEYPTVALPNGAKAQLGMCTPKAKVTSMACKTEADCPPGQGCNRISDRSTYFVCQAWGGATGIKNVGDACGGSSQCRSGDCRDHDLLLAGGASRATCSGPCLKNSQCAAGQRCVRVVFSNNGTTADPTDDVTAGYCITLQTPKAADACTDDASCVSKYSGGADTCDTGSGQCYKKVAKAGDACNPGNDWECMLGGRCLAPPRFPGGACSMLGCDPAATTGVDFCPGSKSTCRQRAQDDPLSSCYEGCSDTVTCTRASEGYACEPARSGEAKTICMSMSGGS